MSETLALVFEPFPGGDLTRFVEDNVIAHTTVLTGATEYFPVGWFLRSTRGEWMGGCMGHVWAGWLHVRWLWVSDSLRGLGHGTRMMDAAEKQGIERGAAWSTLETFNPDARIFYERRGYEVFASLSDFPAGHAKLFLRKRLIPSQS